MSKQLPESPNLEHLKNEAKALKKQSGTRLAEAQLQVAREYGFPSWAKLKRHVEGFPNLRQSFFMAVRDGDRELVSSILEQAPGLIRSHDPNEFGMVPIAAAASRNDLKMIDLLLSRGADIDARSDWWAGSFGALDFCDVRTADHLLKKGATLTAHAAARLGKAKELREILKENPDAVNERGGDGQFPLHFATTAEIVDILADAGADLDARDIDHESTAAQWRIKEIEVLRRLVERGASTDIFMAVALDDPALIGRHLKEDPAFLARKTNEPGNPMIHHAAPGSPIYIYTIGFCSPLQMAASQGKPKAYEFLFDQAPPTQQLLAATWKADRESAMRLKGHIKDLSPQEMSQVSDAARYKQYEALALMLEVDFDVDAQDHEQMAAAHWAGFIGDPKSLEIILPHKPNLNLLNCYGGTVLGTTTWGSVHGWNAKHGDYPKTVQMLIDAGAEVKKDMQGSPAVNEILNRHRP